jgi:glutamate-1-semialdehyde 2,1-aminomutase
MRIAGYTSTGSKRPHALFGGEAEAEGMPQRMTRSQGCRVWDAEGREYLDFIMGLGAVGLGYGHPEVNRAAIEAIEQGSVGPLAPVEEEELATQLASFMPGLEEIRFVKTGAEAVAAAVRVARAATQRDRVLGCGYHGWLDWCSREAGVPTMVQALFGQIPFNDIERTIETMRQAGDALACVVLEPVVDGAPDGEWLRAVRTECTRIGALLVYDEVKTAFRVAPGGAAERWGGDPDLLVVGKALANGFPLAAVGGRAGLMEQVTRTWISSTLATEFVSLAAALATLRVMKRVGLSERLAETGTRLFSGLGELAGRFPERIQGAAGIPEMCYLRFRNEADATRVARAVAARGILFKRNAYNFVSLAHQPADVDRALEALTEVIADLPGNPDHRPPIHDP